MSVKLSVNVNCPYCGVINNVILNIDSHFIPKKIVTCDSEIGGCDNDFVIDPHFEITAGVYKIEGIAQCKYCF